MAGASALDAATRYTRRGWKVLPVPYRSKNPGFEGWQHLRIEQEDLSCHFNCAPQNIGVLLGEPSQGLIDVDLDHQLAIQLARDFLPLTPCVFGRVSKPRSHWVYRVLEPVRTKRHKSKSHGMIVELRSTGTQTVFPPSVHESGEQIEWEEEDAEPALIKAADLQEAVARLATAVLTELGETASDSFGSPGAMASMDGVARCLNTMLRINIDDQNDGSHRLFALACRVVEYDLSDHHALIAIREVERQRPFPRAWTDEQVLQRVRDAERTCVRGSALKRSTEKARSTILIDAEEHRVVTEAIDALAADPDLFQRGQTLVRVVRERSTSGTINRPRGSATICPLPVANLRERLTRWAILEQTGKDDETRRIHPPNWLVSEIDARGEWPKIRRLAGVSDAPILRADGSVCQQPGYDAETCVLYEPDQSFPLVPADLELVDAKAALNELLEIVCDFRFERDEHQAAWVAALLTPLARYAFKGPAPLFLVDANVRGAGKGLLVQTIALVTLGREMPVSSYSSDSDEMCKKITAIALAGDRLVLLDNVAECLGNAAIDRALTATRWQDRLLGKNQVVDLPLDATWFATGNNVVVGADTVRRLVHVRLDVLEERPEERRGFRFPNLLKMIRDNRAKFLTNALIILSAYCRAGRPPQNLMPFGSYEGWSDLVRSAVVWLGLPDPCLGRKGLAENSDTGTTRLLQLMYAWRNYPGASEGLVVADLLAALYPKQGVMPMDQPSIALRAAIEAFLASNPAKPPDARRLGNKLSGIRRRVLDGAYFDTGDKRSNGAVWLLHSTVTAKAS